MDNLKVLMVVFSNLYKDPRVTKMAKSVSEYSSEIEVIAPNSVQDKEGQLSFKNSAQYKCTYVGVMNNESSILKKLLNKLYTAFLILLKLRNYNGYILHCHDLDAAVVGALAKVLYGNKLIYDSHEVWIGKSNITKWMVPISSMVERFVIKKASHMISVSESAANFFKEKYKTSKVTVITNSVHNTNIRKPLPEDKFTIMYQGRYVKNRGLKALIESSEFLPKSRFQVILRGFGRDEDSLRSVANGLSEKGAEVTFLPPVPMEKMAEGASECHLAVVLTERTCLNHILTVSNKLYEYAAVARPMLLSNVEEHELLVDRYGCGIISEVEPRKIANAILEISENQKLYESLALGSSKLGEERSWDREVEILKAIYSQI